MGCECAYARSHSHIRGSTSEIPKEPYILRGKYTSDFAKMQDMLTLIDLTHILLTSIIFSSSSNLCEVNNPLNQVIYGIEG